MKRLASLGCVAIMTAGGLVGCQQGQKRGQVQAPPPPEPQPMSMQPSPFDPVQVQPGAQPQPLPMDPYGAAAPAPTAPGFGGNYTIQKGDTLWSIAQRHYGNGQRWVDILNANPGLNPNKLSVGQSIILP